MNALTSDAVAIDTNVFSHLTDKKVNADGHIGDLLSALMADNIRLLADDCGVIDGEYPLHLLTEKFLQSEPGRDEVYLLEYWLSPDNREVVSVDNDDLLRKIERTIADGADEVDRMFVYVAFAKSRPLVSNDYKHISGKESKKRLRKIPESKNAAILTSKEAAARV